MTAGLRIWYFRFNFNVWKYVKKLRLNCNNSICKAVSKISSCQIELLDTKWSTKTKVDKWFGNFVLRTLLLFSMPNAKVDEGEIANSKGRQSRTCSRSWSEENYPKTTEMCQQKLCQSYYYVKNVLKKFPLDWLWMHCAK